MILKGCFYCVFENVHFFPRLLCRLQKCNLKGYCLEALALALGKDSSHLKELDLSDNDFMDAGLQQLCAGLKSHHCTLQTLRFWLTHLIFFLMLNCISLNFYCKCNNYKYIFAFLCFLFSFLCTFNIFKIK